LSAVPLSYVIFEEHYTSLLILVIFVARLVADTGLISASGQYCTTASVLLLSQHRLTKHIGRHVIEHASGFTAIQHNAIHFALSFFVISELKFYRQYIAFKWFDNWLTAAKWFLQANVDPEFHTSRDLWSYMSDLPRSWRRYLDGDTEPRGFFSILFSKPMIVDTLLHVLFHVIGGYLNYPIKRIVNPDPDGGSFLILATNCNIFFEMSLDSPWTVFLGLGLLRVVRQANYLAFWVIVRVLERAIGWLRVRHEVKRVL
jgi:hypothetical protein